MFSRFRQQAARAIDAAKALREKHGQHSGDDQVMNIEKDERHSSSLPQHNDPHGPSAAIVSGLTNIIQKSKGIMENEHSDDPEVGQLVAKIHQMKLELKATREKGKRAMRRRQQEHKQLKGHVSSKSRELWVLKEKSRHFGLNDYKTQIRKCSLPCHDLSGGILAGEAKLLRAQHNDTITQHQHEILLRFQQEMIDYMHTTALPAIHDEKELAAMVGKSQVDKMQASKDRMEKLYESCFELHRRIMEQYKVHDVELGDEHQTNDEDVKQRQPTDVANNGQSLDTKDNSSTTEPATSSSVEATSSPKKEKPDDSNTKGSKTTNDHTTTRAPESGTGGRRGDRSALLERARSTRLHGNTEGSATEAKDRSSGARRPGSHRDRSGLGTSNHSHRDRGSLGTSNHSRRGGGLSASEHRPRVRSTTKGSATDRSERTRSKTATTSAAAAEREARMERLASRRRGNATNHKADSENAEKTTAKSTSTGLSAERRAQLRENARRGGGKGRATANGDVNGDRKE